MKIKRLFTRFDKLIIYREKHPHTRIEIKAIENIDPVVSNQTVIGFSLTEPNHPGSSVFIEEEIFPVCSTSYVNKVGAELMAKTCQRMTS